MLYTNAMTNMLNKIDENTAKLMVHYLDRFMETQEEPTFKGIELKKYWFLLLVDGLINEIRYGENQDIARTYLAKLLNYNSKFYENKKYVIKTINEVETKAKNKPIKDAKLEEEDEMNV